MMQPEPEISEVKETITKEEDCKLAVALQITGVREDRRQINEVRVMEKEIIEPEPELYEPEQKCAIRSSILIQRMYRTYLLRLEWTMHDIFPIDYDKNIFKNKDIYNKYRKNIEDFFINKCLNMPNNASRSGKLGEHVVKHFLKTKKRIDTWKPIKIEGHQPDLECENFIYEIKTRNWTGSGTAGEKVLGVPYKYADIPTLYGKPLKIVLVANQEEEFVDGKTKLFEGMSDTQKYLLDIYKSIGIEYVRFSTLIE